MKGRPVSRHEKYSRGKKATHIKTKYSVEIINHQHFWSTIFYISTYKSERVTNKPESLAASRDNNNRGFPRDDLFNAQKFQQNLRAVVEDYDSSLRSLKNLADIEKLYGEKKSGVPSTSAEDVAGKEDYDDGGDGQDVAVGVVDNKDDSLSDLNDHSGDSDDADELNDDAEFGRDDGVGDDDVYGNDDDDDDDSVAAATTARTDSSFLLPTMTEGGAPLTTTTQKNSFRENHPKFGAHFDILIPVMPHLRPFFYTFYASGFTDWLSNARLSTKQFARLFHHVRFDDKAAAASSISSSNTARVDCDRRDEYDVDRDSSSVLACAAKDYYRRRRSRRNDDNDDNNDNDDDDDDDNDNDNDSADDDDNKAATIDGVALGASIDSANLRNRSLYYVPLSKIVHLLPGYIREHDFDFGDRFFKRYAMEVRRERQEFLRRNVASRRQAFEVRWFTNLATNEKTRAQMIEEFDEALTFKDKSVLDLIEEREPSLYSRAVTVCQTLEVLLVFGLRAPCLNFRSLDGHDPDRSRLPELEPRDEYNDYDDDNDNYDDDDYLDLWNTESVYDVEANVLSPDFLSFYKQRLREVGLSSRTDRSTDGSAPDVDVYSSSRAIARRTVAEEMFFDRTQLYNRTDCFWSGNLFMNVFEGADTRVYLSVELSRRYCDFKEILSYTMEQKVNYERCFRAALMQNLYDRRQNEMLRKYCVPRACPECGTDLSCPRCRRSSGSSERA